MTAYTKTPGREKETSALPDLLRPRFFPGQRLTDRDLSAVVDWVRARFALEGRREGWGVVCGLEVTADSAVGGYTPAAQVAPGFAVDARGNPMVVREPLRLDLPRAAGWSSVNCPRPPREETDGKLVKVGPYSSLRSNWAVYDLVLCADEQDAEYVPSSCRGEDRMCQATRVFEGAKLKWRLVEWDKLESKQSEHPGDAGVALLKRYATAFPARADATNNRPPEFEKVYEWLAIEMKQLPASTGMFPDLLRWIEVQKERELSTFWGVARVLFWLADAIRRAPPACGDATKESCVPLARIWLEVAGNYYAARYIDTAPPSRRGFAEGATKHETRHFLGWPFDEVQRALGMALKNERFELPGDAHSLLELLEAEARTMTGGVVARLYDAEPDQPDRNRVVAFRNEDDNRTPVLTTATTLEVQLFAAGASPQTEIAIGAKPIGDPILANALPAGGGIKLAIDLDQLKFAEGLTLAKFDLRYHDSIQGDMVKPRAGVGGNFLVSTFKIPDITRPNVEIEVTVLLVEKDAPHRTLAISGKVGGQSKPLLTAKKFASDAAPRLHVVPLKAEKPTDDVPLEVIVLEGGTGAELPLTVYLSNPSLVGIRGMLRQLSAKPIAPTDGEEVEEIHQSLTEVAGRIQHDSGRKDIAIPIVNTSDYWFWVVDGSDDFGLPFTIPRVKSITESGVTEKVFAADPTLLKVERKPLTLAIAGNPAHLTITNTHASAAVTISRLSVTNLTSSGTEQIIPLPAELVHGAASPAIRLGASNVGVRWRIILEFQFAGDTKKSSTAIDVKAT